MDKFLIKSKPDSASVKPKPQTDKMDIIKEDIQIENTKLMPWVEKYRPKNLDDVVFQSNVVNALKSASSTGKLQHLLFYGSPGTGKTSTILAVNIYFDLKQLAKELFTPEFYRTRILELNASDERGISVVREKIKTFSQSKAAAIKNVNCPDFKIVILDEADSMTIDAQSALRRVIEDFTETTRFCIICNYVSKIIDPITSRCAKFRFNPLTLETQIERLKDISIKEDLNIDDGILEHIISITDGDLRRSINLLQSVSQLGKNNITEKIVNEICGIIPQSEVMNLFEKAKKASVEDIDKLVNEFIYEGYDINQLLVQLTEYVMGLKNISNKMKADIVYKIAQSEKMMIEGSDYQLQVINLLIEIKKIVSIK